MFAKQCLAVWSTLWRRPGAWLLAAVFLAAMAAASVFIAGLDIRPDLSLPYSGTPYEWVRPETTSRLNTVRDRLELESRDRQRPLSVAVSSLLGSHPSAGESHLKEREWLNAREKIFQKLSAFTQVVGASWKVRAPDADTLRHLAALPGLRGLKLDSYEPAPDSLDLGLLEGASTLERLDLGWAANPDTDFAPLNRLPRLTELAFSNPGLVTHEHMSALATLPHLHRLYLPALDAHPDAVPALAALNKSTTLKVVDLPLTTENEPLLAHVRHTLPQLGVRRGHSHFTTWFGFLMPYLIVIGVLSVFGMQLAAWFSSPAAALTPNHAAAHRVVGWAVLCTALLGVTAVLAAVSTSHFWPLFAAYGVAVLLMVSHYLRTGTARDGLRAVPIHIVPLAVPMAFPLMRLSGSSPWIESYLRGDFPAATLALGVCALLAAWRIDHRLQRMACDRASHHVGPLMSGADYTADRQRDQKPTHSVDAPPRGWWPRPSRVKPDTHRWSPTVILLTLMGGVLWSQGFFSALKLPDLRVFFSPVILGMILFFPLSFTSRKWAGQFALMPQIMLRPAPRREHINRFFRAAGRDFARLWPAVLAIAALYGAMQGGFTGEELSGALAMGLLASGIVGLAYAVVLLTLPQWERSGKMLLSFLAMVLLFGPTFFLPRSQTISITLLSGLALAAVLAAGVLTFIAHVRYQSIEWGKH